MSISQRRWLESLTRQLRGSAMASALIVTASASGVFPSLPLARLAQAEEPRSGIARDNFDTSVPIADDFYLHVNGTWLKRTEIPADKSNYGSFTALQDDAEAMLLKLVTEMAQGEFEAGSVEQKVGDLFRSFINTERLDELGAAPIQPMLDRVMQLKSAEQLSDLFAYCGRQRIGSPFALYIMADAKQSDRYTVYLSQSGTSLPDRDYYLVDDPKFVEVRQKFVAYAARVMEMTGHPEAQQAAERVLALETRLAEAQWTNVENRDPVKTYNPFQRDAVVSTLSSLDGEMMLNDLGLDKQQEFVVRQPSYMEKVDVIIRETPVEVWRDYFYFQVVDRFTPYLDTRFDQAHFEFYDQTLSGVAEAKTREKRGIDLCNGMLGEMLGKLYVRERFSPEAKERMGQLVENLKRAFAQRIHDNDWMSDGTKIQALDKLNKMNTKIGYPDEWRDYSSLSMTADDLVGNVIRYSEFEYQDELSRLGEPVDRNEWHMTPQTVNAYYSPLMNEIVFPAAILQPPFFDMQADDAVNYGAIGAVIGHEISHGFDDKGSKYDGDGNLRNWWTTEDRQEFEARAKLLVEQYSAYSPMDGLYLNGELTLGENIGDLGGLNVAHTAYRLSLGDHDAEVIDGMTGDQRFFYGWGQIWRRAYREQELRRRLLTDPHSPSQYRANGIVSNLDAFYDAFEIPENSPMYRAPEARIRIW